MRELVSVIALAGLTPNESDLEQLWKAIQIAPWMQEYAADTGTVNNIVAAIDPVPPSLIVGTTVRIKIKTTNTGPTTLSLNNFGTYNIKKANSTVLEAGDLVVGQISTLVWTGSEWQIVNYLGSSAPVTENTYYIDIPYAAAGGTADHLTANFSPDIETAAAGSIVMVKAAYTNTGSVDIVCDSQATKAIVRPNGAPLVAGDIVAGQMMLLMYDGSAWQLINPIKWFTDTGPYTPPNGGDGETITNMFVPGAIYLWPTEVAPDGTLECNGNAISRTQYSRLFGIIGTMYGSGNGTTTFNLPDYRGQFPRGWDHGAGLDTGKTDRSNRGDGTTGDHIGTKQADAVGTFSVSGPITIEGETFSFGHGGGTYYKAVMGQGGWGQFTDAEGWSPMYFPIQLSTTTIGPIESYNTTVMAPATNDFLTAIRGIANLQVLGAGETRPRNINTMYIIGY